MLYNLLTAGIIYSECKNNLPNANRNVFLTKLSSLRDGNLSELVGMRAVRIRCVTHILFLLHKSFIKIHFHLKYACCQNKWNGQIADLFSIFLKFSSKNDWGTFNIENETRLIDWKNPSFKEMWYAVARDVKNIFPVCFVAAKI